MENEISNLIVQDNLSNEEIKNLIYTIRGKQVMLDSDVAMLYHYETKKINQAVKRNIERFPEKFCFQLTEEEFSSLRSQIVTLNKTTVQDNFEDSSLRSQFATLNENTGRGKHRKYLPYVFTEQGIAMLSGLLKNDIAIQVSINIMDAFVEMRKFLMVNGQLFERLTNVEYKLLEHDKKFDKVFDQLQNEENIKQKIFFEGQIYDAYSLLIDILSKAKEEVIIIDNYADKSVLDMITNLNVKVIIVTRKFNLLKDIDIKKYNRQYHNLKVIYSDKFHDRFIILDKKVLYHSGASYKDLGNKCFAINKIEDKEYLEIIIRNIGEDKCMN